MKPGTLINVAGRGLATVVYHGLDGYGIVWGKHEVGERDLPEPQAMLRDPYPTADRECVGTDYYRVAHDQRRPLHGEKI